MKDSTLENTSCSNSSGNVYSNFQYKYCLNVFLSQRYHITQIENIFHCISLYFYHTDIMSQKS
jgi:hypothetical protein